MAGHSTFDKSRSIRENLASTWINLHGTPGVVWTGNVAGFDVGTLLAPVAALQVYGTPAELEEKFQAVKAAAIVNRDLPMNDDDRKRLADSFNELAEYIGRLTHLGKDAESFLASSGWKFDHESRKATKGRGHKGRDLLAECAWAIYTAKYRDKGNTGPVRQKIAKELAPYFEASELSPAAGAPIFSAIRYREGRPK